MLLLVAHDLAQAEAEWESSATALDGELLGHFEYSQTAELHSTVQKWRDVWHSRRMAALNAFAIGHESAGRHEAALAYRKQMVQYEPTNEQASCDLIRLLHQRGDYPAVALAFARLKTVLAEDLGVEPAASTLALFALLSRREGLLTESAAPRINAQRTERMVGRENEWRTLLLAQQQRRAVLLMGEPGIGKTRLIEEFVFARGLRHIVRVRPDDARVPFSLLARCVRVALELAERVPKLSAETRAELARIVPELGTPAAGALVPAVLCQSFEEACNALTAMRNHLPSCPSLLVRGVGQGHAGG
jgi:Bacterial transcriptional activator domain/AAA ATPase domain